MANPLPSVLLVEDNADDEELTVREFARAKMANPVEVARDGQEALDFLFGTDSQPARPTPGLVLVDLHLPRVDGLEVLRRIRADARLRLTPVVILTSSSEDRDRMEGYNLGANSFVRKPVKFEDFAHAVSQVGIYWLMVNEPPLPAYPPAPAGIPAEAGRDV